MDFHSLINTAKQNVNTGVKKVCFEFLIVCKKIFHDRLLVIFVLGQKQQILLDELCASEKDTQREKAVSWNSEISGAAKARR